MTIWRDIMAGATQLSPITGKPIVHRDEASIALACQTRAIVRQDRAQAALRGIANASR